MSKSKSHQVQAQLSFDLFILDSWFRAYIFLFFIFLHTVDVKH